MEHITDPRILEIMAQLSHDTNAGKGATAETEAALRPVASVAAEPTPVTMEEFLKAEGLAEWPHRITSEGPVDLSEERSQLANWNDFVQQLEAATPVDMKLLKEVEARLETFEKGVKVLSQEILADRPKGVQQDDGSLLGSRNRTFMTDRSDLNILQITPCSRSSRKKDFLQSAKESKRKTVENCSFPGYSPGELTPLPGKLEAPQLLHRVTKVQDFKPGFLKFWKKIFQSEASAAVMQDAFWWFFIENFQCDEAEAQSKLFDRIADSFVALFTTVNPEIKDKVFAVYADCLAQTILVAFYEAFPESRRYLQGTFLQHLASTTSEWVSGIRPVPGSWKRWDMTMLEPKDRQNIGTLDNTSGSKRGQSARGALALSDQEGHGLDMEDFHRLIQTLDGGRDTSRENAEKLNPLVTRQSSGTNLAVTLHEPRGQLQAGTPKDVPSLPPVPSSRQACGSLPRKKLPESHQIGPGPDLERVMFNTSGRSPLVAHYLKMRRLTTDGSETSRKIRRTEIVGYPPEAPTYRDVISETMARSDLLSQEYQKVCQQTAQDMLKFERQKRDSNRQIAQLQKEILFCKNSLEIKILSEEILDKKNRERERKKSDTAKGYQQDEPQDET